MNYKRFLLTLVVGCLLYAGFTNSSIGQELERDPGQASVLLRGIITDEQGTPLVSATVDTVRFDGAVTIGTKSIEKQTATLIQQGPNGSQLVRWSETDKGGRYRFRVGPGDYELWLLDEKRMTIKVSDEDLVFDSQVERLPRGVFRGKVTDKEGKPLKAEIRGGSMGAPGHAGLVFKSTDDGEFVTERWNDPMHFLHSMPQIVWQPSRGLRLTQSRSRCSLHPPHRSEDRSRIQMATR